jgi:peptide deformylase
MDPRTNEVGTLEEIEKKVEQGNSSNVELKLEPNNVRPILLYGDPLLRAKAPAYAGEVPKGYKSLDELLQVMFNTMYAARGAGLAAPQIGVSLRIFVIDVAQEVPGTIPEPLVFINPKIEASEGTQTFIEGCLSVPGHTGEVERAAEIVVRFTDAAGIEQTMKADQIMADAIQHENDHLDGIMYVDRIKSYLKRDIIKRAMTKLRKRVERNSKPPEQKPKNGQRA